MRRPIPAAALLAAALTGTSLLTGCGASSGTGAAKAELSVHSAYMPQPVSNEMAAGFLTIENKGGAKDELTSVTSTEAEDVTMHQTTGGIMKEAGPLTVPAHGRLVFMSGGDHLMFDQLKRAPRQGQTVLVELHFAESGTVKVEMPVKSATYNPATGH
ncbi:copper chaperone PCu(A)C [Streptomyces sp. NPDC004069]